MTYTVEQLLATLGIDEAQLQVSSSGRYVLILRDPQPDETKIGPNTNVEFTLVDLERDPTDEELVFPEFNLAINGSIIMTYIGGTDIWLSPWTGTVTAYESSSPYVFWKVVAQQIDGPLFDSEQIVEVEVEVGRETEGGYGYGPWGHFPWGHSSTEGLPPTVFIYQFRIADLIPPRLVCAEAIDPFTVRVTFDDDMALDGEGSVLDMDNWIDVFIKFNIDPKPGVNLEVLSVVISDVPILAVPVAWTYADEAARLAAIGFAEEDVGKLAFQSSDSTYWMLVGYAPIRWTDLVPMSQFDLSVDWEMTPGCRYRLTVDSAIEDDSGNVIDPTFSSVYFTGFVPAIPEGRVFDYWENIIPQKNKTEDATRDLERFANCINEVLGWMLYSVDHFVDQWDPDMANDLQIDAMLYDMGNPFASWVDLELTSIQKRKLLRILIDIYGAKGTDWGIEQTVYFLLGELVTVVAYLGEGWILGDDVLGSGSIAEVMSAGWDTWDFTSVAAPWELEFEVQGIPQIITFTVDDFSDATIVTAAELVAAFTARASGAGAYVAMPGQAATIQGANAEPFAISPGDILAISINDEATPREVEFRTEDIAIPGAATTDEIVARINRNLFGSVWAENNAGGLGLETIKRGELAALTVQASSAQVALGLATVPVAGSDHAQLVLFSADAKEGASIRVTGGVVNDLLGYNVDEIGEVGGAILGPDDSFAKYSFDIETENVLTSEQENIVRKVAEYMRPAHTHLINIRPALPLPWPDSWELGVSELDVTTELLE